MSGYKLSILRAKGWLRLGLAGAASMLPITAMEHARGFFAAGEAGLEQAGEFLLSGIALWGIVAAAAAWIARGFAVRAKPEDEEEEGGSSRPSSAPRRPAK